MVEIFVSFLAAYLFLGCLLGYRISMRFAKSDARSGDPLEGGYLALGQVLVFLAVSVFWLPILFGKMWSGTTD